MDGNCDGTKWVLVPIPEQCFAREMITFKECHTPEAPTCKTTGQAHGVAWSMHHLTCCTDAKAKSFCATKCNKACPTNGPTFGTDPVNLMNSTPFERLLCKELNLKVLPTPCIEPSHNTCETNKAVINAHKKKVKNTVKDLIKEIVKLLDPAHCFNVGVQPSKAQKEACSHL